MLWCTAKSILQSIVCKSEVTVNSCAVLVRKKAFLVAFFMIVYHAC